MLEAWDWKEVVVLFVVVYSAALIGGKVYPFSWVWLSRDNLHS